jgi:dTDP-4-dehydrorhamnose reductase
MLGQEFMKIPLNASGFDRDEFDITKLDSVREVIQKFDVVVNCAAWTAVDDAEENEDAALLINGLGPRNVAIACRENGSRMVQISTDYVFSGDGHSPYQEEDETNPKSAYGRTKLVGEIVTKEELPEAHYIVRTAWLFGEHGSNFVKKMKELERTKETISVVDNQFGQPTWTKDLVHQVIKLVDSDAPVGKYHGTSEGATSWHSFAQRIFELLNADSNRVQRVPSEKFPQLAPRPSYSVLGHENWKSAGIRPMRDWNSALTEAFDQGAF